MDDVHDLSSRLPAMRLLGQSITGGEWQKLRDTLQGMVDGIADGLGFESAALFVMCPDTRHTEAIASAGRRPDEMHRWLGAGATWEALLHAGRPLGSLRVVAPREPSAVDLPRHGVLIAPFRGPAAELVGLLAIELPNQGGRPTTTERGLLELFASQAALAVENAWLRARADATASRLEREQMALRASEDGFRQAFENAPSGMAMVSVHEADRGRIMRVNGALCAMVGHVGRELRRRRFHSLVHPDDRPLLSEPGWPAAYAEVRLVRRDSSSMWVALRSSAVPGLSGSPGFLLTHVEDIDERKRHIQALVHRAAHDPLTGLPHRAELLDRLRELLRVGTSVAVLFWDLDNFKEVNDSHGHQAGDAVLMEVARRLGSAVRDEDVVARMSGDEFVVVAVGVGRVEAEDLAERLLEEVANPVVVGDQVIPVDASVGVSWTEGPASADDLLRVADLRMYEHKRSRARVAG